MCNGNGYIAIFLLLSIKNLALSLYVPLIATLVAFSVIFASYSIHVVLPHDLSL